MKRFFSALSIMTLAADLASCAAPSVRLAAVGERPAFPAPPFALSAGADQRNPVVIRLRERGLVAAGSGLSGPEVLVSVRERPRRSGVCPAVIANDKRGCVDWLAPPRRGLRPLGAPIDYGLTLRFIEPATGVQIYRIDAAHDAPADATDATMRRLADAVLDCRSCAGGPLLAAPNELSPSHPARGK